MDAPTDLVSASDAGLKISDQENTLLWHIEIVGLPVARAAIIAGVNNPHYLLRKPHMLVAREQMRLANRGRTEFSREDIIAGIGRAIEQATVMADPTAAIKGYMDIAKLKGYDKTPNVNLHITGNAEQIQKQLAQMSTADLLRLSGNNVLDGDFYPIGVVNDDG